MHLRHVLIGTLALSFACVPPQTPEPPVGDETEMGARLQNLSDGQIAEILLVNDTAEIHTARMMMQRSEDPQITALAEQILRDHAISSERLRGLVSAEGIQFRETAFSRELEQAFQEDRERLDKLRGDRLSSAYVDLLMEHHSDAIDLIEDHLEPAADRDELEDFMDDHLPMLRDHLLEARRVQSRFLPRG